MGSCERKHNWGGMKAGLFLSDNSMAYAGKNKVHRITQVMTYHTCISQINSILSFTTPRCIIAALCHPHTWSPLLEVTRGVVGVYFRGCTPNVVSQPPHVQSPFISSQPTIHGPHRPLWLRESTWSIWVFFEFSWAPLPLCWCAQELFLEHI